MFVHAIPDNRGKKDGYYCSLVESNRDNGTPSHRTVVSFGFIPSERLPYLKATFNAGDPADILKKAIRSQEERRSKMEPQTGSGRKLMEKAKMEFIARITTPDGKVIERTVESADGIPAPDDFDMSSKEGFLNSFDAFEKATLEARNRIGDAIAEGYLNSVSKKNGSKP